MLPLILKNSDYFDLEEKESMAYYDLNAFIAYSGKKFVLFQRVFESNSSYWLCFSADEEIKRFISLKALYSKCLTDYLHPVFLSFKLSKFTSKIINDVNLVIHDEVKKSFENFCVEKDKELAEFKKKRKVNEHMKGWRRLIEKNILFKYGMFN